MRILPGWTPTFFWWNPPRCIQRLLRTRPSAAGGPAAPAAMPSIWRDRLRDRRDPNWAQHGEPWHHWRAGVEVFSGWMMASSSFVGTSSLVVKAWKRMVPVANLRVESDRLAEKNGNHQTLLGIWTLALGSSKMWENHVKNWNPSGETVHRESSSLPNPKYSWFSAQWTVSNTPKLQSSAVGKTWIFQLLFFLGPPKPAVGCLKLCSCELFGGSTGPPMNSLSNRWKARCGPKTHS